MNGSRHQQALIKKFIETAQTDRNTAIVYLNESNWDINNALSDYFNRQSYGMSYLSNNTGNNYPRNVGGIVDEIFKKFFDKKDDCGNNLGPNGVAKLLQYMNIDFSDRKVLILAWMCEAKIQGEFSREELEAGILKLDVRKLDDINGRLTQWDRNLETAVYREHFKSLYEFTYDYGNDKPGRKWLPIDVASAYWEILFKNPPPLMPLWLKFLKTTDSKKITKDTWNLVLEFMTTMDDSFRNYTCEDCWPVLIDEFVEYAKNSV
uniref:Defective in cullin neddylation protein n=1 Tax=Strongyloides papillosus TaxID=174720 RepID=A0A0N5BB03_STREA